MRSCIRWLFAYRCQSAGQALLAAALTLVIASTTGTAHAAVEVKAKPTVQVTITAPETVRQDRLANVQVVFTGVDAKTKVRVSWGDGSPITVATGTCGSKGAIQYPSACAVTLSPTGYQPGQYTITATSGRVRASKAITVTARPQPWAPPAGWVQPTGWSLIASTATYPPCQTIPWSLDRTGESADRATMVQDIAAALAFLTPETGLTFVQTTDPKAALLTFAWGDLSSRGASVAGVGGPRGDGTASVTFSSSHWWTKDEWAGRGTVRVDNPNRPGWYYTAPGRQSLVIHEVMHALGFGHVNDITSMMFPQGNDNSNAGILNPADREGLRTMYLNNPCPAAA